MNKVGTFITKESPRVGQLMSKDVAFKVADLDDVKKMIGDLDDKPDGFIAGYASTNHKDHADDVVVNGAFQESIDRKGLSGPDGIKLLLQHRSNQPAGVITKLMQTENGLWMEAQLNLNISYVKDAYEAAKMNGGLNFSVGYRLVKDGYKFVDKGEESFWMITKADLHEVSVVTFPCNEECQMTVVKGITDEEKFESLAEFEKALVASGLAVSRNDAAKITRVVKRNSPLFTGALEAPEPEPALSEANTKAVEGISAILAEMKSTLTRSEKD